MKEFDRIKLNDIPDEPSEELRQRTLAAMRAAEESRKRPKKSAWRKIAVCAAIFCSALVLMGAGVKVFDFMAFIPGMGIVTADQSGIYILERTVDGESCRIEAVSMVPVTEGEYKGLRQVTVLTDLPLPEGFVKNPELMEPMMLTCGDETYPLTCSGKSATGARFSGYADADSAGEYTVAWGGADSVITVKSIESSRWANYEYPTADGITAIVMPLAEDSRYLVFDIIFDPASENMKYWAEHCSALTVHPRNVTVTDAWGIEYSVEYQQGTKYDIPESEMGKGINGMLEYKIENILTLSGIPAADIVKIEIQQLNLGLMGLTDAVEPYVLTLSDPGETVDGEELPGGGVFMDQHGITLTFTKMRTTYDSDRRIHQTSLYAELPEFDFEESVYDVILAPECIRADRMDYPDDAYTACSRYSQSWGYYGVNYGRSTRYIIDHREGNTPAAGHDAAIRLRYMYLLFDTGWVIDFTEAESE